MTPISRSATITDIKAGFSIKQQQRTSLCPACHEAIIYVATQFKKLAQQIHDHFVHREPNRLNLAPNRVAASAVPFAMRAVTAPLSKESLAAVGQDNDVAVSADLRLSPFRSSLCVGMSMRFAQQFLSSPGSPLLDRVSAASNRLRDGADKDALIAQHLYEQFIASRVPVTSETYEKVSKAFQQQELSKRHRSQLLEPMRSDHSLTLETYAAILDVEAEQNADSSYGAVRASARRALVNLMELRCIDANSGSFEDVKRTDILSTLNDLTPGCYQVFLNSHSFAIIRDENQTVLFDVGRGCFQGPLSESLAPTLLRYAENENRLSWINLTS